MYMNKHNIEQEFKFKEGVFYKLTKKFPEKFLINKEIYGVIGENPFVIEQITEEPEGQVSAVTIHFKNGKTYFYRSEIYNLLSPRELAEGLVVEVDAPTITEPKEEKIIKKKSKPKQKPPVRKKVDLILTYTNGKKYTLTNVFSILCNLGEISIKRVSFKKGKSITKSESIYLKKKDLDRIVLKTPSGEVYVNSNTGESYWDVSTYFKDMCTSYTSEHFRFDF